MRKFWRFLGFTYVIGVGFLVAFLVLIAAGAFVYRIGGVATFIVVVMILSSIAVYAALHNENR